MVARIALPSARTAVTVACGTGAPAGLVIRPTIAPSSAALAPATGAAPQTSSATTGIHFPGHLIAAHLASCRTTTSHQSGQPSYAAASARIDQTVLRK